MYPSTYNSLLLSFLKLYKPISILILSRRHLEALLPQVCVTFAKVNLNHSKNFATQPTFRRTQRLQLQLEFGRGSKVYLLTARGVTENNARIVYTSQFLWARSSSALQTGSRQQNKEYNIKGSSANINEKEDDGMNIGEGSWEEVYKGVLTTQLKLLKMFSIGTSLIGLSVQPILYEKLGTTDLAFVITLASMFGFFTFITPALIHFVSKKYVIKLEYDPERDIYAATTLSFFLKEKKLHFKVDDVVRPDIPGMFTSFLVKNQPLFVDPNMFDNVDHYSRIMGYDKPVDFGVNRNEKLK